MNDTDPYLAARQAYIYLHGFHKTLGDTISILIKGLNVEPSLNYTFDGRMRPHHRFSPSVQQNANDKLARWTWDWLPLYAYSVFYRNSSAEGTDILEAAFTCDERWDGNSNLAPDMPLTSEDGSSRLSFYRWIHDDPEANHNTAWNESDWSSTEGAWQDSEYGFRQVRIDVPHNGIRTLEEIEKEAIVLREKFLKLSLA